MTDSQYFEDGGARQQRNGLTLQIDNRRTAPDASELRSTFQARASKYSAHMHHKQLGSSGDIAATFYCNLRVLLQKALCYVHSQCMFSNMHGSLPSHACSLSL